MYPNLQEQSDTPRRVVFYRTVTNEAGLCGRCVIDTVHIRRSRSAARAAAAAQLRFRRRFGLASWDHFAHGYEVDEK